MCRSDLAVSGLELKGSVLLSPHFRGLKMADNSSIIITILILKVSTAWLIVCDLKTCARTQKLIPRTKLLALKMRPDSSLVLIQQPCKAAQHRYPKTSGGGAEGQKQCSNVANAVLQ